MTSYGMTRRRFMMDLGRGGLAVAVLGITTVACSTDDTEESTSSTPAETTTTNPAPTTAETNTSTTQQPAGDSDPFAWERVNLGFVSAYVLARDGEAVVVDTGVAGSESAIESSLGVLGLGWSDVGHVIVTHLHNDHQGSLPAVMELAADATGYAGAADIPGITAPRDLVPVGDGDNVYDLRIIATPGHTPGHISILDPSGGVLITGDALRGENGGVIGPAPEFTDDLITADASVQKLTGYTFDTLLFGHGEPIVGNAYQLFSDFAASI